jgi:hypothetical protein
MIPYLEYHKDSTKRHLDLTIPTSSRIQNQHTKVSSFSLHTNNELAYKEIRKTNSLKKEKVPGIHITK